MTFSVEDFANLSEECISKVQAQFNEYQNKYFPKRSPEFFCLELNGEAGELANAEKKHWKGKYIPHKIFEDETADVCIALINYSNARGIDLGKAVKNKLLKIEKTRVRLAEKGESY